MTYKIAVASSDGVTVDGAFGDAAEFLVYQIEGEQYRQVEHRKMPEPVRQRAESTEASSKPEAGCCGGHAGHGGCGCGASDGSSVRIDALADCRSIVCRKIGPHAGKLLERKAIAAFDVDCSVEEALKKIILYYNRVDRWKR